MWHQRRRCCPKFLYVLVWLTQVIRNAPPYTNAVVIRVNSIKYKVNARTYEPGRTLWVFIDPKIRRYISPPGSEDVSQEISEPFF